MLTSTGTFSGSGARTRRGKRSRRQQGGARPRVSTRSCPRTWVTSSRRARMRWCTSLPTKKGRPILLYRSALHAPGAIDPNTYTRYVIQQTERAIAQYDIGRTTESIVVVDRIGSGLKNQDPALLRVLIPVILNHYPYQVGAVYVAPTS